jgi:DNA-binding CsgD family transcriptional regulator
VRNTSRRIELALRLLDRCGTDTDVPALTVAFLEAACAFGLESGAGGAWVGMGARRAYRFYFNTWPADWLAIYNEHQVFFDDPIVLEAQRRMTPFRWSELEQRRPLSAPSQEIMKLAHAYGWADGLVVPVHGPAGYQGVVSLASRQTIQLSPSEVSSLWMLAMAVHARCRDTPGMGISSSEVPRLTAREAACMAWIAAGKTDWEAAQLLGISPSTVHFHVERVKKRLGSSSRTEAAALLVLHGAL